MLLVGMLAVHLGMIFPDRGCSQIQVGNGPHQAHLLFQFESSSSPVWFVVCFEENSITSAEALNRIQASHPEFGFQAVNWGTDEEPNLFLSSLSWRGRTLGSQDLYDENNRLLGGYYWGVFTAPDEGIDSPGPFPSGYQQPPLTADWGESMYGISQRVLRHGYWDAYVYQFVSSTDWIYHQLPALPPPRLSSFIVSGSGSAQIQWASAPGITYVIQSCDDLASPFVTNSTRTASSFTESWEDPDPRRPTRRFYRLGLLP